MNNANDVKKAYKLRPSDFQTALKSKSLYRGVFFHLKRIPTEHQNLLGIIIPKRLAKRAITRNTIKRVIKASFHQQKESIPSGIYIIRLHKPIPYCSLTCLRKLIWEETKEIWKKTT